MLPVAGQPNGQGAPLSPTSGTTGGVGGPSASPPGGTPKSQRKVRPPQTFAGMQQQGMARPSPQLVQQQAQANQAAQQAAQTAQMAQPTQQTATAAAQQTVANSAPQTAQPAVAGQNPQLTSFLNQQVMALLQDPTQGLNEAAQSNFDRQNRTLGREFSDLRGNLNENMAARGLDASTIAATKLGELGARQAEAQSDLAARIQEGLIRDRSAAMNNAIQAAMGLRGQDAELDQMLWSRSDADRRFGLDQTLGLGNLDLNRENLALNRDRFAYDQFRDNRNFDYGVTRDQTNDAFRTKEFDWRQGVDARDFDYRQNRDTIGDQQYQEQFDYRKGVDARDFDYRQGRDAIGDQRWTDQWDRDQTWRNDDTAYRDRRDTVGDQRWQQTFDTANNQQNTQNIISLLQGMGFNSLGPDVLNNVLRSLGITLPSGTSTTSGAGVGAVGGGTGTSNTGTFF